MQAYLDAHFVHISISLYFIFFSVQYFVDAAKSVFKHYIVQRKKLHSCVISMPCISQKSRRHLYNICTFLDVVHSHSPLDIPVVIFCFNLSSFFAFGSRAFSHFFANVPRKRLLPFNEYLLLACRFNDPDQTCFSSDLLVLAFYWALWPCWLKSLYNNLIPPINCSTASFALLPSLAAYTFRGYPPPFWCSTKGLRFVTVPACNQWKREDHPLHQFGFPFMQNVLKNFWYSRNK